MLDLFKSVCIKQNEYTLGSVCYFSIHVKSQESQHTGSGGRPAKTSGPTSPMRPCLRKQTKAPKCKTTNRTLFLTGLRHSSVKNSRHSLAITVIGMTARRHNTAIKHYTTLQKSLKHVLVNTESA